VIPNNFICIKNYSRVKNVDLEFCMTLTAMTFVSNDLVRCFISTACIELFYTVYSNAVSDGFPIV
jgi:hypothetical protein